jgi:5-methylcytosine-specific restriction enzyme B
MSRYCGGQVTGPIFEAANHWKNAVLVSQKSVFGKDALWVVDNLDALTRHFVDRPDLGSGAFLEKLEQQLAPTPGGAKQLAAEMMWVLYLCPSSMSIGHKRDVIGRVWSWSNEAVPDTKWLSDEVLVGIGSGGPGFNQNQWRELAFLVNFAKAFLLQTQDERVRLLDSPWDFDDWLRSVPDWESRQFRHMLLFLLFPDDFERIFGQRDRREVVRTLGGFDSRAVNGMDPVALDKALRETRRRLEAEYGTDKLDYYAPPLHDLWKQKSFADVAGVITAEHVHLALADIDRDGTPASAQSTGYDLIEAGKRYPPKLVFSLAAKHAAGHDFSRTLFTGGVDSQSFKVLQKLGFEISSKDLIGPLLERFLAQAKAGSELSVQGYLAEYRGLSVKVSFGKGNFARIPWIAFLKKGQAVSKGIYPVFLLFEERKTLLLCYGVSETNDPDQSWEGAVSNVPTVSSWYRSKFGQTPDRYGNSHVRSSYDVSSPLPMEDVRRELDSLIDEYEALLGEGAEAATEVPPEPETIRADVGEAVRAFAEALRRSNIDFGARHDDLVASFLGALIAKPLVILTGLSGSGKTQIAIKLGEWLGRDRLFVAAVRPDWTGAEALFGYEDGLKPPVDGRSAWAVPAALEFMLAAAADPANPYLLLLDEMNLSHVERYFADVLSGMESEHACLPNLVKGSDGMWRVRPQGPDRIAFPRNLWIVGTVNVDETTYMFSPKVLDRASTFEFRVTPQDLGSAWRKPTVCEAGDPAIVRGLLSLARDADWQSANPGPFQPDLEQRLRQLHSILGSYSLEFGHRVFYESLRYAAFAHKAGLDSLEKVLDRIVFQKVLPRLHGSRKKLEAPVLALMHFCHALPGEIEADAKAHVVEQEALTPEAAKLPLSYGKLARLLRNLRANQFASFTE